jgi:hypothetical protein
MKPKITPIEREITPNIMNSPIIWNGVEAFNYLVSMELTVL